MAKTNIEIEITPKGNSLIGAKWQIICNGVGFSGKTWSKPDIFQGIINEESQTVITTPDVSPEREEFIYKLVSYALGDI